MSGRRALRERVRRLRGDGGQAVVEGAIVLPAMIFLVLTLLQLTMVQHARIMTDYAAFCAARAGIVFNGDRMAMERAANLALLPTMTRTDNFGAVMTASQTTIAEESMKRLPYGLPVARVRVLSPMKGQFGGELTRHLNDQEIDFDDTRSIAAQANILQIRVEYFYRMPIPFANQILQNIFFAQRLNILQYWQGVNMTVPETGSGQSAQTAARMQYGGSGDPDAAGLIAAAHAGPALGGYFFPLEATYSMRMQSNMYQRNAGD